MGMFNWFGPAQTEEEAIAEAAQNLCSANGADMKAVAITAISDDGVPYHSSGIAGEGYVGNGVDEWTQNLADHTEDHAATLAHYAANGVKTS